MTDSKNYGWVRLHRKIENNYLWFLEPFTKAQAWIDLFLNANHKDGIIQIRGNIIKIKRGQIGWSEITMCKRWTWSKNKTRRFLKLLETEQQIEQQKTAITTIITILKYDNHQTDDTADDTTERQQKDSRRYTNKNDKNVKNDKNEKNKYLQATPADKIPLLIKEFEEINPTINYGNKTQRKACEELIAKFGYEKVVNTLNYYKSIRSEKFSPTITTPYMLQQKMGELINFYNKSLNKNKITIL